MECSHLSYAGLSLVTLSNIGSLMIFCALGISRVVDAILKVIEAYRAQKAQGETLHQWVTKVVKGQGTGSIKSLDDVKALLAQVIQLPAIEQDPDAYRDYGSDAKFTAKTARGECAA